MSGTPPAAPPPPARLRRRRFSFVWLIPLIAAGIALYLGYRTYREQGPLLTLTFNTAEGLRAGQTQVKYKAVALGTVESIDLSRDNSHVIVRVRMNNVGARFLTSRARFWVVRAHFSFNDFSSLDTLVTGAYIAVDPGKPGGHRQNHFAGLEEPPGVRSDQPGRTYQLTTDTIGALHTGSLVFYRDVAVGEVLGYNLGNGLSPITVSIFVRAPFDDLVHPESHFWNASGLSLEVQPGAFHVEFQSLQAVLSGGVAFDLPEQAAATAPSPDNATFPLFASKAAAQSASFEKLIPAVAYFHSSVAGLARGSPVELYGIQIGVVTGIRLILDPVTGDEKVRVAMALQPERNAHEAAFATPAQALGIIQKIVDRGTRLELASASLVTGQKDISLVTVPGAGPAPITREGDALVLPTHEGGLDAALSNLTDLSAKLDQLPVARIGANLNRLLETTDSTIGSKATRQSLTELAASLHSLNITLTMLNQDYGNDSDFQRNLEMLMAEGSSAFSAIKQLGDYLDRHPSALIFGRGSGR